MKKKILILLACICTCAGFQTAQAQDYGIDIYGFKGKAYAKPSGELIYSRSADKKKLYLNCENVGFSFFVYDKKIKKDQKISPDNGEVMMSIVDTLPKIEVTTKSKGKIMPSKVVNEINIVPNELGKFIFTVIATVKGKKIMQDFVFEVMAPPRVIIICVDENGKYLDRNVPLDLNNMPSKIKAIAVSIGGDDFQSQCPKYIGQEKVEGYRIILGRGVDPVAKNTAAENTFNLENWKGKIASGDRFILTQIVVIRKTPNGEKIVVGCDTKDVVFDVK